MKRFLVCLAIFGFLAAFATGSAHSATYNFELSSTDLSNAFGDPGLNHDLYYIWGITQNFGGETVTSATLSFNNISNWIVEPNWLYVYLVDSVPTGLHWYNSPKGAGSTFDSLVPQSNYAYLDTLNDLPTTGQNIVLDLGALSGGRSAIDLFGLFVSDTVFGIGLDPHCHYWLDTISLNVVTAPVPEPGTLVLLGSGLVGIASWGRRRVRG